MTRKAPEDEAMRVPHEGPNAPMDTAAAHLRRFRLSLRPMMGVREAAERCGVSAVEYGEWERGKRAFDFELVSGRMMADPQSTGE